MHLRVRSPIPPSRSRPRSPHFGPPANGTVDSGPGGRNLHLHLHGQPSSDLRTVVPLAPRPKLTMDKAMILLTNSGTAKLTSPPDSAMGRTFKPSLAPRDRRNGASRMRPRCRTRPPTPANRNRNNASLAAITDSYLQSAATQMAMLLIVSIQSLSITQRSSTGTRRPLLIQGLSAHCVTCAPSSRPNDFSG